MSEDRSSDELNKKRKNCRHTSNNKFFLEKRDQPKCDKCGDKIFEVYCLDCGRRLGVICECSVI